jgi:hypothetical protein
MSLVLVNEYIPHKSESRSWILGIKSNGINLEARNQRAQKQDFIW